MALARFPTTALPAVVGYTYWGYRFNLRAKNAGWRLDYALVSRTLSSVVDRNSGGSGCFTRRREGWPLLHATLHNTKHLECCHRAASNLSPQRHSMASGGSYSAMCTEDAWHGQAASWAWLASWS